MGNPFEDLRQAVVVRPMNSPGPQGAAGPELKIQYSFDGSIWHDNPVTIDKYLRFSTDNGVTWSDAIYFNNLAEAIEWVEKAKQWAENPENIPVEDDQYSALHHAIRAARSELNAEAAALNAAESAVEAFGAAAPAWDNATIYNYNDVVSFGNGHTYRCIGTDIIGADHAPNINGVDNVEEWTRITVSPDGYFEVDENGDFMPMITPITSEIFMLDENGDITHQPDLMPPYIKIQYSNDGQTWHDSPTEFDIYLRFSTDNGASWGDTIRYTHYAEMVRCVEKAKQWAANPLNYEVELGQYSALHYALNAEASALDAAESAAAAFGAAAPAWNSETVYNYNDVVSFNNGHTYRCIGTNIVGADHAPNIDGVDDTVNWTRITVAPDGYFEVDENEDLMPMLTPISSEIFMLDEHGDITYQPNISLSPTYLNGGVYSIIHVSSFKELAYLPYLHDDGLYKEGLLIHLSSFYIDGPKISSNYYYDSECPKSEANGITKIDLDKMGSIAYKHADTDLEAYYSEQGTGSGLGCLVLCDQPIYYLEQAGAVGDGVADDSIPFNNLAKAVKHIEGTTISSYGYTYRLDSLVYVYNHLNIKGTLLITKNDNKVGGLRILDTLEQRYDELDIESLGEIKALSNELSGLPLGSEYKYIGIFSSEQIPRYHNYEMIYYNKRHFAQIIPFTSLSYPTNIHLGIHPAPPFDMAKEHIFSVRLYKLRPRLNIELDNIILDNTSSTGGHGGTTIISIHRDSVRLSFNNYEQMSLENGAYNQIYIDGNGFIVDGGNLFNYGGYSTVDSYGINVGNTCGGLIKNLNASTNWHNIVARHCSNLTILNSSIQNVDTHMGSNWYIDNCIVSRIDFAGSDLTVKNSTIFNKINLRSDTPIARGTLKLDNVTFISENTRLISAPMSGSSGKTEITGDFNYDATFFDYVFINNCHIDNKSSDNINLYFPAERGTSEVNIANEWSDNKIMPPKLIMISGISISSDTTTTLVFLPGAYFREVQYVPKVIISDVYNSKDGEIIPIKLTFYDTFNGLKADTEQDIPCLMNVEVHNIDGCNIAVDSRGMNKHKLINCENITFDQPYSQSFDIIGVYEGREDKGITEIIGGSLSRLNYDRYRYAKIAMSGVNLKEVPILNSTSYKSKIIKMVNCYSELADDIPHMNYYIDPNYFTYSYGPMHFTVSALPTNVNTGSIAFATDALKEGESPGAGTGTMVYYDGTIWRNLYNNAQVTT